MSVKWNGFCAEYKKDMMNQVQYGDNIFALSLMVKTLRKNFALELDPELFLDKAVEDLFFIHESLNTLFTTLTEQRHIVWRTEYMRGVMRSKMAFSELLKDISEERLAFGSHMRAFTSKFKELAIQHSSDTDEIRLLLTESGKKEAESQISEEEFHFLLSPDNDDSND